MTDAREPTRLLWAGLAAATTAAFLLRWHFAGEQSLGYEEVFTRTIGHLQAAAPVSIAPAPAGGGPTGAGPVLLAP